MLGLEAAHDLAVAGKGRVHIGEIVAVPPERIALGVERPVFVDAGMDEEQRSVLGKGGTAQARHELDMATAILHALAQFVGPAGQLEGAGAGAAKRRFAVAARCGADGTWINRYGYLSDRKLAAIEELWR